MKVSMKHWWSNIDRENSKNPTGRKTVPVPLWPPQVSHGLAQGQTWASAVIED